MAFVVYTDFSGRRSTIHRDSCVHYQHRKAKLLPSSDWLKSRYSTVEEAEAAAKSGFTTMHVHQCKVCSP